MRISEATKKIIGKELPWLIPLLPENAYSFRVEVMDADVLALEPWGYQSPNGTWTMCGPIYLVDSEGRTLGEVGTHTVRIGMNSHPTLHWGWPFVSWITTISLREEPETVEQTLYKLGASADEVRYIVVVQEGDEVVLHRLPKPKDVTFKGWMEQKLLEEKVKLQKQLKRLEAGL